MPDLALADESLTTAPLSNEGADDYPDIVAVLDERTRLIRSHDTDPATQWIVQKRLSVAGRPNSWRGRKFFQNKAAMVNLYHVRGATPRDQAAIDALPDWCPQRPRKGRD